MEVGEEHKKTGTKPTTVIYRKVRKERREEKYRRKGRGIY